MGKEEEEKREEKEQCLNDTALNGIVRADEVAKQTLVDESDNVRNVRDAIWFDRPT